MLPIYLKKCMYHTLYHLMRLFVLETAHTGKWGLRLSRSSFGRQIGDNGVPCRNICSRSASRLAHSTRKSRRYRSLIHGENGLPKIVLVVRQGHADSRGFRSAQSNANPTSNSKPRIWIKGARTRLIKMRNKTSVIPHAGPGTCQGRV